MISRLTAIATLFAVIGAASLAIAADSRQAGASTDALPVVHMERVTVIGKRIPDASR
jgi:hypothetical protein